MIFLRRVFLVIFLPICFASFIAKADNSPFLSVKQLDGKEFDLDKMRGKVVLVNFWAVWCKDCREEMPALDALYKDYHNKGLEIISLSIDRDKDRDDVLKSTSEISYPVAMVIDAKSNSFDLPSVIPTAYFINKKGKIVAKLVISRSAITKEDFEAVLEPLLVE